MSVRGSRGSRLRRTFRSSRGKMANADKVIRCPSCGANNRISSEKLQQGLAPVCAKCKAPLPTHAGPITVTDETFAAKVERSKLPVLIDFWAAWCGPCRMIAPVIDKLASQMGNRVRFAKLNIDENRATASRFKVDSIPTLLIMKGGREMDRIVGLAPEAEIRRRVEKFAS
jgi:thioredoxin 2